MSQKTREQLNREFELTQPYCHFCDNFSVACVCEKAAGDSMAYSAPAVRPSVAVA